MMTIIAVGALAYNATLYDVARTRMSFQDHSVSYPLTECLIALPYGQAHYIDKHVRFWDGSRSYELKVVDVEQRAHAGQMLARKLAADVNCKELVHKRGYVYVIERDKRL